MGVSGGETPWYLRQLDSGGSKGGAVKLHGGSKGGCRPPFPLFVS